MPSEIKQLLEQIEAEQLATLRGMNRLSSEEARRLFIEQKQRNMDIAYKRLAEIIKPDIATALALETMNCAWLRWQKELWITYLQQRQVDQLEIENVRVTLHTPTPFHQRLHKKPHDNAKEGDILLYKLKPYDQPVEPDRLWYGCIKMILTDRYSKRDYFVESLKYPGSCEMVYSSQVYGYISKSAPSTQEPQDSQQCKQQS